MFNLIIEKKIIKDLQNPQTIIKCQRLDRLEKAQLLLDKKEKALKLRKLFNYQDKIAAKYGHYNYKCNYN